MAASLAALFFAAPAAAQVSQPLGPWDGQNPFNCVNQDVGTGTSYPDPGADPFCVEFDKTNQNVTDFGIADFLANEPARTAAAAPKCFYFQQDHWTGSIVQDQQPEAWHWDGDYFFDKAKGIGGVSVHNFRIGGQPADFTPYVPAAYRPYIYPGGGGGTIVTLETDPDPQCMAMVNTPAERRAVYRAASGFRQCIAPGGTVRGRHVGRVRLGESRKRVRKALGKPGHSAHGVDRWCVVGAASLRVAYSAKRHRAKLILSTSRGHAIRGVGRGTKLGKAKRTLHLRPRFRVRHTRVLEARSAKGRRAFIGTNGGIVRWIAIAAPHARASHAVRAALKRPRAPRPTP